MQEADNAYNRGIDNLADGRFADAVADLTQAIELDPQLANAYRLRGIAYKKVGETAMAEADYDKAKQLEFPGKQYEEAVDAQRSQDEQANRQAVEAVKRGVQYLEDAEGDRAIECFTEAIRLSPQFANAYFARACAYDDKGDFDLAVADCTKVVRLASDHFRAYRLRGDIYEKTGKWALAERDLAKARRLEAKQR